MSSPRKHFVYEVKSVLDKRIMNCKLEYFIEWENTWETAKSMKIFENKINQIIDTKFDNRPFQYLVQWRNTWEKEEDLDCEELIELFKNEIEQRTTENLIAELSEPNDMIIILNNEGERVIAAKANLINNEQHAAQNTEGQFSQGYEKDIEKTVIVKSE